MFSIVINKGERVVEAEGGRSLLTTLADSGIWLPSICGGTAACGECACAARGSFAEPSSVERAMLGDERLALGMRLACSIVVSSDVEIALPTELLAVRRRRVEVAAARKIARDTRELVLDFGDEAPIFRPGQYLRAVVPPHRGLDEAVQRAYSFASAPGSTRVSIIVRRSPTGLASVWLHDSLRQGDSLDIVGPFGTFGVDEGEEPILCVAGGTGLAPFFPILASMASSGVIARRDVVLVFGVREVEDLFGLEVFETLARQAPRFRFVPVVQEPDATWTGAAGSVTDIAAALLDEAGEGASRWKAALCGSPGMVKACERLLARHGIQGEAVRHDSFA